jgi:glycosyltransferase involved in cell wall biosynthesis
MKKKLLVVTAKQISLWGSCKVISSNLQKAYANLDANDFEIKFVSIDKYFESKALAEEIEQLATTVLEYCPDEIVFSDHLPLPNSIIKHLLFFIKKNSLPVLVFHIYGDFTFCASEWFKLGEMLAGCRVRMIVASESQKKLVRYFLENSDCLDKYLFPVDSSQYYFNEEERQNFRRENNIRDHEQIILYTGRVSLQKNVDLLISNYVKMCKATPFPVKLWIVGSFDDLGAEFQGINTREGYMFSKIQKLLENLPEIVTSSIKFWGHQEKETLRKLYNASDMFMSLSLYHDEDFGMSPAEALSCGLPTLLTDWGGYSSFASSNRWYAQLVDVDITEYGLEINAGQILKFFKEQGLSYINKNDRMRWSDAFSSAFSIEGSNGELVEIFKKPAKAFKGFNLHLSQFSAYYWGYRRGNELNLKLSPSSDSYYSNIYSNYISRLTVNREEKCQE